MLTNYKRQDLQYFNTQPQLNFYCVAHFLLRILNKLLINNHSYPKKSQEMFHLPCYTLKKSFPFIDTGFQEDPISTACVKSSPEKHSLFFNIVTINYIQGLFCIKLSCNSNPWVLLEISGRKHPSKFSTSSSIEFPN